MEELEKELLNSLDVVKDYLAQGADLAAKEVPLLIGEVIQYNLWYNGLGTVFGVLFLLVGLYFLVCANLSRFRSSLRENFGIMGASSFIFGVAILGFFASDFLKAYLAPRLFLLEYVKDLL